MKTAVEIPDPIFAELKIYAVKEKRKLKDVIVQFLIRGLEEIKTNKQNSSAMSENLKKLLAFGASLSMTQSPVETLLKDRQR